MRLGANDHPDYSAKLYCVPLAARRINCDLAALQHVNATVGEHLHDLGIQHMLDRMDVLLERVDVPALLNSQRTLGDDGAVVVDLVGKVHGHAGHLDAASKRIVDRMGAGKARQQRRM